MQTEVCGTCSVRKLLVWKTNKEAVDPRFPAYVVHWTDYSPGRSSPIKAHRATGSERDERHRDRRRPHRQEHPEGLGAGLVRWPPDQRSRDLAAGFFDLAALTLDSNPGFIHALHQVGMNIPSSFFR